MSSGSSLTAAGIPTPSFRMSLSLTPVTACSFFSVCLVNTSQVFFVSKNCVKDLGYHKTSSINGFPSGASISRNGSGCLQIWKSLTGLSLRTFCHTTAIPLFPWVMPFSVVTHLCSPMPVRHPPDRKPHNTTSSFIPRISLYSDYTTMGWLWDFPCFMMDKTS